MHEHAHRAPTHDHFNAFGSTEMAELAELEGEVLGDLTAQAVDRVVRRCLLDEVQVRRVLDLGCGPGVGTTLLARRFPDAQVVAVDGSAAMLERVATRAAGLGLSERVQTRTVDLSTPLEALGPADVVWMSMALHHLGDETDVLRRVGALLEPRGLLALVEQAGALQILPVDAERERPGIGARLDAAWASWLERMRSTLPDARISTDHPTMLRAAGYELVDHEVLHLSLDAPLDSRAQRFAHRQLAGVQRQLGDHADPADLADLDTAYLETLAGSDADGEAPLRDDLTLRTARHLFLARPIGEG